MPDAEVTYAHTARPTPSITGIRDQSGHGGRGISNQAQTTPPTRAETRPWRRASRLVHVARQINPPVSCKTQATSQNVPCNRPVASAARSTRHAIPITRIHASGEPRGGQFTRNLLTFQCDAGKIVPDTFLCPSAARVQACVRGAAGGVHRPAGGRSEVNETVPGKIRLPFNK